MKQKHKKWESGTYKYVDKMFLFNNEISERFPIMFLIVMKAGYSSEE